MELFFNLAYRSGQERPAGWIGQITSNSFMKREFGSKLIEEFLPHRDLRTVIDTSGAYIPGHGTPTVILVGRGQSPSTQNVRAVLGVRGEPGPPEEPSKGLVWKAIVDHVDRPGYEDAYVTVVDLPRSDLNSHPWSLSGGGAAEAIRLIESTTKRHLGERTFRIGVFGIMGSDDAFIAPYRVLTSGNDLANGYRPLVQGEDIRDFQISRGSAAFFPYSNAHKLFPLEHFPSSIRRKLWPVRTELGNRATFSRGTYFSDGRPW